MKLNNLLGRNVKNMERKIGKVIGINGPVVRANNMTGFGMREMVIVGKNKLIGEIIALEGDNAIIQIYEETEGTQVGEDVEGTGNQLSVKLGPGIISNMFDGIERPLIAINKAYGEYIPTGIGLMSIDVTKLWDVKIIVKVGDVLKAGDIYATVDETKAFTHKIMVPPNLSGKVVSTKPSGKYNIEEEVVVIEKDGVKTGLKLYQEWPVRVKRPTISRKPISIPLSTGQRIIDTLFPIAKGGTAAIPGGFGTGKTVLQHQFAKWCDADIIIYIGCGERGNEMVDVLDEFPKLVDPRTGNPLMERTALIANISNMPVAAREASIYTGITLAEYYKDMGYHVAVMADSTSRWAEALREISGRLEDMPAEEGYPAYLSSRLAEFYERAGYFVNLNGTEGSITVVGAVSPSGGDLSEPVTQNTKRYVTTFLNLDKNLAYERHFPAVNWNLSYSGYVSALKDWYEKNISKEFLNLRTKMFNLLAEENKLMEIVKLVGDDVLSDTQKLILKTSRIIKVAFLQQNSFDETDSSVPLEKQYRMLKIIVDTFYEAASKALKKGAPMSSVEKSEIFEDLFKMKYNIPNNDFSRFDSLEEEITTYYNELCEKYND